MARKVREQRRTIILAITPEGIEGRIDYEVESEGVIASRSLEVAMHQDDLMAAKKLDKCFLGQVKQLEE